ncbi:hypothetical protein ETB97_002572 [Aspergillus alliaceus]|uniref:Wax synthase domain-containing protein n=1 Tax=Petromyces alliaceus TaxID=209559 RepID=A0A8H6A0I8_PETAA|nr:hypothetical protein ETB97_002572 [Aspergillus burnettii]
MEKEPQDQWSVTTGSIIFLLAMGGLTLGWAVLMLPPQIAKATFPYPMIVILIVFYRMSDVFPDDTANEIWGMSALIWLSHMSYVVYIHGNRPYGEHSADGNQGASPCLNRKQAFKMLFNCRGINTPWAIDPAFRDTPPNCSTATHVKLQMKGSDLSHQTNDSSLNRQRRSRLKFCMTRVLLMLGRFSLLCLMPNDIRSTMTVYPSDFSSKKRSFFRRVIFSVCKNILPASVGNNDDLDVSREALLRLSTVFHMIVPFWFTLESYHDVFAIVYVGFGLDSPDEWPPLFGNIAEAYTVRRYWSKFWQKLPYRSYGSFASLISTRIFRVPEGTMIGLFPVSQAPSVNFKMGSAVWVSIILQILSLGAVLPSALTLKITAGSLESLELSKDYHSTLAHACLSSILMAQAVFWISSATGLWPRHSSRAPEYYDCLWLFSIGAIMIPVLYLGAHLWEGRTAVLLLIEHIVYALMVMAASQIGIWLSRKKSRRPKRNLMSSFTWFLLGHLMVAHHQWNAMTKKIHEGFGYALIAMAAAKALDILANSHRSGRRPIDFSTISSLMIIAATWELCVAVEEFGLSPLAFLAGICTCALLVFFFILVQVQYIASFLYPEEHGQHDYAALPQLSVLSPINSIESDDV